MTLVWICFRSEMLFWINQSLLLPILMIPATGILIERVALKFCIIRMNTTLGQCILPYLAMSIRPKSFHPLYVKASSTPSAWEYKLCRNIPVYDGRRLLAAQCLRLRSSRVTTPSAMGPSVVAGLWLPDKRAWTAPLNSIVPDIPSAYSGGE